MKSYEEFSPEAKQAIEQFRKFTSNLRKDQVECESFTGHIKDNRPIWFVEPTKNWKSFRAIVHLGCHMFGVNYSEAEDLTNFAKSKNYWISKEIIDNSK